MGDTADVAGLLPDTEYEFQIAGLNDLGSVVFGDSTYFVTSSVPVAAPDAVVFTSFAVSGTEITLNWATPENNNSPITSYVLQYKAPGDADWTLANQSIAAGDTSVTYDVASDVVAQEFQAYINAQLALDANFAVSDVVAAAIKASFLDSFNIAGYSFRLAAINGAAPSSDLANFSDAVVIDVVPATVIDSATDMVDGEYGVGFKSTVTLNWMDPANSNTVPTTGWSVQYRATGSNSWISLGDPVEGTTADVAGLLPDTEYEFQIAGMNQIGDGAFGNSFYFRTSKEPTFSAPDAPSFGSSTSTATSIVVSWTAPEADGGVAVTGYKLAYRGPEDINWNYIEVGDVLTYQLTGLANSSEYEFQVAAVNPVGTGAYSDVNFVKTKATAVAPATVFFGANSALLSKKAQAYIKSWVKKFDSARVVSVDGYANSINNKMGMADTYAKSIAAARTAAVVKLLRSLGLTVKFASHAGNSPVDMKNGAKNRRVVLSVK